MQQQSYKINFCFTCLRPHDDDATPTTDNNFMDAPPPTITDTILPPPPPAPITVTNTTCPIPATSVATSDYLPPVTSNVTTAPSTSNGDSVLICPHCDRTFNSHIGLFGHLRIHRTETGGLVPGAPTHNRDRHLQCPHCSRAFTHHMVHTYPRKFNPPRCHHILRTHKHFPQSSHERDYQQSPHRLSTSWYILSSLSLHLLITHRPGQSLANPSHRDRRTSARSPNIHPPHSTQRPI
ncbi:unnamed protein product [Schistocephalus solidus]|uniref:C2H2-type domain-containing protein n=1 Tax=Schistocephalus solidus TaxID=70667 RepID=A0A183SZL6_SCHSO|nr:unnamed protein product [Schistocephalus solidus]